MAVLTASAAATWYAGDFERLGTSARIIGMGGAAVTTAQGPSAIYYNPARAGLPGRTGLLFLHSQDFSGLVQHNFLGAAFPSGTQSFGVAVLHNGIPGIKLTALPDSTRPPGPDNRPYVERVVSANQLVGYVNYARTVLPELSVGGNVKLIYQDLGVGNCFGMGLDLGLLIRPGGAVDVGLRIRNASLSPLFWSSGTRELITPRLALGIGRTFGFDRDALVLAIEAEAGPEERDLGYNLGAEYSFRNALFGRLGAHDGNLTFGLGARFGRFYLDYGYAAGYAAGSRELGSAQQFSGGVEF
ncbi:MAG TPA: hypothetical protein ENN51_04040 [candidate division WOR-3 bacterium]|uniref:PorV/PorQ family protein n=1 Tax=candidate division WOR-3 bacterium TaxID=2052148 RepID=A0A7V0XF49_UNCW3|nr:hypothetical protein [candidate division WOR-3 bacterium]